MLGFRNYAGLENIKYSIPEVEDCSSPENRSPADDLMDMIFTLDSVTNLPCGALNQYLSDKTNQEVRDFIEKQILVEHPDTAFSTPQLQAREVSRILGDEFLAHSLKSRSETVEQYEDRISGYIEHTRRMMETERNMRKFNKKLDSKTISDDN